MDPIIALLLDLDHLCTYPEKKKELLKSDVLAVLDEVYEEVSDKQDADEFIRSSSSSLSPKTRRKAKKLARKYDL